MVSENNQDNIGEPANLNEKGFLRSFSYPEIETFSFDSMKSYLVPKSIKDEIFLDLHATKV